MIYRPEHPEVTAQADAFRVLLFIPKGDTLRRNRFTKEAAIRNAALGNLMNMANVKAKSGTSPPFKSALHYIKGKLTAIAPFACLALIWEASARAELAGIYLPPLTKVISEISAGFASGQLAIDTALTLSRLVSGILLGCAAAFGLACALGWFWPGLGDALAPLARFLGQINPYTTLPLFVLFFGLGEQTQIACVAWTAAFPAFFAASAALGAVDPQMERASRSMGEGRWGLFAKVAVPSAAPFALSGLRVGAKLAFFVLTASEMTGANAGLNYNIHYAAHTLNMAKFYANALIIVFLGLAVSKALSGFEERALPWAQAKTLFGMSRKGSSKRLTRPYLAAVALALSLTLIAGAASSRISERMRMDHEHFGYNEGSYE